MYQLASPVTEWGAPGAFTRRWQLFPNYYDAWCPRTLQG